MAGKLRKSLFKEAYTVALICPLEVEMSAVRYMLDDEHSPLPLDEHNPNRYVLGELSGHNVVISSLPEGSQGTNSAAAAAIHLARSFSNLKLRLLVGIGGGVSTQEVDIRLGDVVISTPSGTSGGVVEYDLGKQNPNSFERKGFLCPPPPQWRSIVTMMKSEHRTQPNKIKTYISEMILQSPSLSDYRWPGADSDILFSAEYEHANEDPTCLACDKSRTINRNKRKNPEQPHIFYGIIASGNRVLKHARERDRISQDAGGAICFEMEAAGLMNHFPCIVIRGICDYADSHKNDAWHAYAAAVAAACCREMLTFTEPIYDESLSDLVLSTTVRVTTILSETKQTLEVLSQKAAVLKTAEQPVLILENKLLDLHRILAVIELFLRQKRSVSRMVQIFKTLEYLCSDVSTLLSRIRASIHMLSHRTTAHSETDLSLTRAEIGSLCLRLKEYTGVFSEMLATIINMYSPVSYHESEHALRIHPRIQSILSIQSPQQSKTTEDSVSEWEKDKSDVPAVEMPESTPPHIDSISVAKCERFCPCQCHIHSQFRVPKWVKGLLGSFTWQANGSILLNRRACDYRLYHKSRETYVQISYVAPSWAFLGALSLRAARLSLRGRNASISFSLPRVISHNNAIWSAISSGKLVEIRKMVAEQRLIMPNDVSGFDTSLLQYATILGQLEIATFLIDQGANRFFQDSRGFTAIQPGLDRVLTRWVKDEHNTRIFANNEILDEQDFTIFHQIVLGFCHTELEKQFKFSYREIDLPDVNNRTPLLWAAWRGDIKKVRVLLELGADPNKKDLEGYSPLAKAAQAGHFECVRALVEGGATVNTKTVWDVHLISPTVSNGLRIAEYLLAHGSTATAPSHRGWTPLHCACYCGATSIVSLLLKHGVDIDIQNELGDSPVMVAAQIGHDDITCLLIDMGARLDFQSNDGLNLVHFVVIGGSARMLEALTRAVHDGRVPVVSLESQHEGHGIKHCFEICRPLEAFGFDTTAKEKDMFQRLLDAFDGLKQ